MYAIRSYYDNYTAYWPSAKFILNLYDGVVIGNPFLVYGVDLDIGFEIYGDAISYTFKELYSIGEIGAFDLTTTSDMYSPVVSILTAGSSVDESISSFCYTEKCSYHVLNKTLDGGYARSLNGKIRFKYDEEYYLAGDDTHLTYSVCYYQGYPTSGPSLETDIVKYGDNRFILSTDGLASNAIYVLEVTNSKNEKRYLKFKVDPNNTLDCND